MELKKAQRLCDLEKENTELKKLLADQMLKENRLKTIFIDPGCPWQNGYVESFNSRSRFECLDRELLCTLGESRVVLTDWRNYDNHERPHRLPGLLTPKEFTKKITRQGPGSGRPAGSLRRGLSDTENNSQPAHIISWQVDQIVGSNHQSARGR